VTAISHIYVYIYIYATAIFIFNFITAHTSATTSDPMRWRGSSAEHVCCVLAALGRALGVGGRAGPFHRAPAATPSPSEPGPSLHWRPLGRYSSAARGSTAVRAGALKPSINELIDTTFGSYPSSKAADAVPKGAPSVGTQAQHATLLMPLKCCNFRPTGPFGTTRCAGCVVDGDVCLICRITTGLYGRYTAPAGVWPAPGPEAAGTSAAQWGK
jgi:hypothetical protein